MPSYEEDLSEFERRNAQVLGISADQVFSNEAWAKSMGGLSYPLLSDFWPHGYVSALYGVLRGEGGQSERAIFVVDREGKVAYIDVHDINEMPPTDKIMQALDRLK
jgi:peroxiredoxin